MKNQNRENENVLENLEPEKTSELERKKTIYVPDHDVIAYGKASKEEKESEISVDEYKFDNEKSQKKNLATKLKKFFNSVIPKKTDSVKTIIIKCVSIVAALGILASGSYLIYYFVDISAQNSVISGARTTYNLNRDDYSVNDAGEFSKFEALKAQNSDIVGWISIEGTDVDNPVYQTDNNDFYITHDMNKQSNSYGSLFLDYRCDINRLSVTQNQIIYGHNMRYGAMFGSLKNYRDLEFYKQKPIIKFDSLFDSMSYKIFAVMIVNTTSDNTFGYDFSAYRTNFLTQEDFLTWAEQCKAHSLIDTPVDVKSGDEIITLSTCCYDFTDARLVIVARRVRNGESTEVDVNSAVMNDDVLYTKEYYDKKKLPIPSVEAPTASIYEEEK